jgi:hypothetical protein
MQLSRSGKYEVFILSDKSFEDILRDFPSDIIYTRFTLEIPNKHCRNKNALRMALGLAVSHSLVYFFSS